MAPAVPLVAVLPWSWPQPQEREPEAEPAPSASLVAVVPYVGLAADHLPLGWSEFLDQEGWPHFVREHRGITRWERPAVYGPESHAGVWRWARDPYGAVC